MSAYSLSETPKLSATGLLAGAAVIVARLTAAWRRYDAERQFSALSYDTLKDIGFRSADETRTTPIHE